MDTANEEIDLQIDSEFEEESEFDKALRLELLTEQNSALTPSVPKIQEVDDLTAQAIAELEKDARRAQMRSSTLGVTGFRYRSAATNRKYLINTVIGTMQANRRIDNKLKARSDSHKKHGNDDEDDVDDDADDDFTDANEDSGDKNKAKRRCTASSRSRLRNTILGNVAANKIIDEKYKNSELRSTAEKLESGEKRHKIIRRSSRESSRSPSAKHGNREVIHERPGSSEESVDALELKVNSRSKNRKNGDKGSEIVKDRSTKTHSYKDKRKVKKSKRKRAEHKHSRRRKQRRSGSEKNSGSTNSDKMISKSAESTEGHSDRDIETNVKEVSNVRRNKKMTSVSKNEKVSLELPPDSDSDEWVEA